MIRQFHFILLVSIILVSTSGCKTRGIKFDPDFYISDYQNVQIVNEDGLVVKANDPEFNNYACMHMDKIIELKEILIRARMPKSFKKKIIKPLDNVIKYSH